MTEFYRDEWLTILQGDVREVLPTLPSDSVDCIVTSPPYWGLRDYGNDGQIGLERTPEEYVANMIGVFRELRRILKPTGTAWLNLGDCYATGGGAVGRAPGGGDQGERFIRAGMIGTQPNRMPLPGLKPKDLVGIPWRVAFALQADGWYLRSDIIWAKPNPMPESVTDRPTKAHEYLFLLTKSARYYFDADAVREPHNSVHLGRYARPFNVGPKELSGNGRPDGASNTPGMKDPNPAGRNIRSVWTIATKPYPGAHFAVFPPELPKRCIKAGSSERGVCRECGAPWERVVSLGEVQSTGGGPGRARPESGVIQELGDYNSGQFVQHEHITTGWRPTCGCSREAGATDLVGGYVAPVLPGDERSNTGRAPILPTSRDIATADARASNPFEPQPAVEEGVARRRNASRLQESGSLPPLLGMVTEPAVVLDPFAGSGTTGMVANRLSRRAILIDLNGDYLKQQLQRNAQTPLGLGAA